MNATVTDGLRLVTRRAREGGIVGSIPPRAEAWERAAAVIHRMA
jgi:hypothetical protein